MNSILKLALAIVACLSVFSLAQIPEMRITTQNNANPQSKNGGTCPGAWTAQTGTHIFDYIAVTNFQITGAANSSYNFSRNTTLDSIRLRGNSTADADKKPYRIKFGEKTSLFGKEAAKSWVLLANFYDGTFALNAMAFELGKRLGLDFTPTSQLVNLYINNNYMGIYQLTEQIQSNKGRVDIKNKHNGWLVEFDYHAPASDECLRAFTTGSNRYNLTTTIKAPELDDFENPKDSTQLRFVKNDIMALVNKMAESGFPNNGYRDLIDLESFAKYMLIQLVMDNFDFNSKTQDGGLPGSNFAYKIEGCSKIQAGPLWDFDLAAGVRNDGGFCFMNCPPAFPSHYQTYQDPITPTHAFYKKLWEDPVFKAKYKKAWDKYKSDFTAMSTLITDISTALSTSIAGKGTNTWANNSMMTSGTLTKAQFDTEISNLKTWWTNRLNWVDQQLSSIDASKDIAESTPSCNVGSSSSSSKPNSSSSSSANGGVTLSCTGLQATVAKGGTIAEPILICSNGNAATNPNWTGRPSSNTSWTTNSASTTASYTIGVMATCGSVSGLTATCGTVTVGNATPIMLRQTASGNIRAYTATGSIILENLPGNARIELYNLQGKRIYSAYPENPSILRIMVKTKGMYIVKVAFGGERKILRISVM